MQDNCLILICVWYMVYLKWVLNKFEYVMRFQIINNDG